MKNWTEADIPDQTGRTVLVTGANSGLGLQTALVLAGRGARVLIACRDPERGEQALRTVSARAATAPELISLDLADLTSVRAAVARAEAVTGGTLDVLINNAGLMAAPESRTADGFELQFGTNFLGHAALTWLLMPALRRGTDARVVTLSSLAAIGARVDFDDPNFEHRRYNPAVAYGQSKIANQIFALELDRRLRAAGADVISVAAHPGYTSTNLNPTMARNQRNAVVRGIVGGVTFLGDLLIAQGVRTGALPSLVAATASGVNGGDYIGPRHFAGVRGNPTVVPPLRPALDRETGRKLWELAAKMTGVTPDPA
ncbi:oxidoreductase [Amycolatopsis endophytica]|uniref:NAD(P)-dependent dehydrogenase (Short-subunit alcohol dehydrogenase family) n=1 Tax=Amycolatopsis endophytica TaxID=860233 RepID=A0A853B4Y1_9PSEU|nr:oxidoreductase [Amycolatopsis endophytica]NYI90258.1 NAD(P)-dependent dehydrogenase (short-subunit alcohol dehydrogenase family) [Amycolatopsis endophytica]